MPLAQKNNMACFQTWKKKENMHRNSNGFGVFARASVRNSIGRNAHFCGSRLRAWYLLGDPYKPSFVTGTGRGDNPKDMLVAWMVCVGTPTSWMTPIIFRHRRNCNECSLRLRPCVVRGKRSQCVTAPKKSNKQILDKDKSFSCKTIFKRWNGISIDPCQCGVVVPVSSWCQAAQNPALVKLRQAEPALEASRCDMETTYLIEWTELQDLPNPLVSVNFRNEVIYVRSVKNLPSRMVMEKGPHMAQRFRSPSETDSFCSRGAVRASWRWSWRTLCKRRMCWEMIA